MLGWPTSKPGALRRLQFQMLCPLVATHSDTGSTPGHLRTPYRVIRVTAGRRWSDETAPPRDSGGHGEALRLRLTSPQNSVSFRRAKNRRSSQPLNVVPASVCRGVGTNIASLLSAPRDRAVGAPPPQSHVTS